MTDRVARVKYWLSPSAWCVLRTQLIEIHCVPTLFVQAPCVWGSAQDSVIMSARNRMEFRVFIPLCSWKSDIFLFFFFSFRLSLLEGTMNWHFPFFVLTTVTLSSVYSQFNSLSLEELGSDTGIQVFNQIIKSRPQENIVVSPHGIASILGMLQLGADGRTKKQLTTVMRYSVNGSCALPPSIHDASLSVSPECGGSRLGLCVIWDVEEPREAMQCHLEHRARVF